MTTNENPQTRALNKRTARANWYSGIICIPTGCIGRTYERYIDTVTGIITLIPTDRNTRAKPTTIDSSLTPSNCEECRRPLTEHDRQEAPYADGKFLCGKCRAKYMELHHSDPFLPVGGFVV